MPVEGRRVVKQRQAVEGVHLFRRLYNLHDPPPVLLGFRRALLVLGQVVEIPRYRRMVWPELFLIDGQGTLGESDRFSKVTLLMVHTRHEYKDTGQLRTSVSQFLGLLKCTESDFLG